MELQAYINPLKKWWWLLLLSTLVAVTSSYLYMARQPQVYRTSTTLMIGRNAIEDPNPRSGDIGLAQQLAGFYAQMAQRAPIQEAIMEALAIDKLPEYHAYIIPQTQFLEIAVVDTDAQRAQAVANEVARQLILQSPMASDDMQQRQDFIRQRIDQLEAAILETEEAIEQKQAELVTSLSARAIEKLKAEISGLEGKVNTLQANHAAYLANTQQGATNIISVMEPASLPRRPADSGKFTMIVLAGMLGLTLAAGAAYLLEYLDNSLKDGDDVARTLGLSTLGMVPFSKGTRKSNASIFQIKDHPAVTESFRELRTNLQFLAEDRSLRTLLITSPAPTEGKTLAAVRLAVALAQAGQKIALLDVDLHRPQLHAFFELPNDLGITTVLQKKELRWHEGLYNTSLPGLAVMPAGPFQHNTAELLGSPRLQKLLAELATHFDTVILDSPPVNAVTDATILATRVEGVILIASAGKTRRDVARRAVERLRQIHAPILGVLLNRVPLHSVDYHRYGYSRQVSSQSVIEPTVTGSAG